MTHSCNGISNTHINDRNTDMSWLISKTYINKKVVEGVLQNDVNYIH